MQTTDENKRKSMSPGRQIFVYIFSMKYYLKQGDALSPLLFNFALRYAIKWVQVNQDGLKLNGTHQLLVYADYVNILGESIHIIKKNTYALVVASKDI